MSMLHRASGTDLTLIRFCSGEFVEPGTVKSKSWLSWLGISGGPNSPRSPALSATRTVFLDDDRGNRPIATVCGRLGSSPRAFHRLDSRLPACQAGTAGLHPHPRRGQTRHPGESLTTVALPGLKQENRRHGEFFRSEAGRLRCQQQALGPAALWITARAA